MKYPTKRLIIWRSLVQAQAGPRSIKQRKSSRYKQPCSGFFLHTETPCTQFAHNLWKVVIINDKRDTPVNDILFLLVSSIGKSSLRFMPMMRFSHIICTNGYKKRDKLHTGSHPFSSQNYFLGGMSPYFAAISNKRSLLYRYRPIIIAEYSLSVSS